MLYVCCHTVVSHSEEAEFVCLLQSKGLPAGLLSNLTILAQYFQPAALPRHAALSAQKYLGDNRDRSMPAECCQAARQATHSCFTSVSATI